MLPPKAGSMEGCGAMGKHRIARSARRGLLVAAVVALAVTAFTPGASADEPQVTTVAPIIDHACLSGSNLTTVWGYTSTGPQVTINEPDTNDDHPELGGD